jgi:hypothetical protein
MSDRPALAAKNGALGRYTATIARFGRKGFDNGTVLVCSVRDVSGVSCVQLTSLS